MSANPGSRVVEELDDIDLSRGRLEQTNILTDDDQLNNSDDDIICMTDNNIENYTDTGEFIEDNESVTIEGNNKDDEINANTPSISRTKRRAEKRMMKKRRKQLLRNLRESQYDQDILTNEDDISNNSLSVTNHESSNHRRNNMNEQLLNNLINDLAIKIRTQHPYIANIKRPQLLLQSLRELNDMVGMDRLKEGVTLQVIRLIESINNNDSDLGMLNTILYGDPGVGKTRIGIILAKIWYSIGFLESNASNDSSKTDQIKNIAQDPIFLYVAGIVIIYGWAMISGIYKKYGMKGLIISLVALGIVLAAGWYFYTRSQGDIEETTDNDNNEDAGVVQRDDYFDRSIIRVVSGEDFIAGFVGQSAIKTKALLQECLGKVLFIDEAYSLYEPPHGSVFGAEALAAINLFMSENAGKIVVVFAGYKDKMQQGIFKIQPGLPRRCMWHFECDSYDGKQLSEIFLRQLQIKGWKVDNPRQVRQIISDNVNLFPSYGGDTERLIFFSQLAASKNHFYNGQIENKNMLTVHDIMDGLQYLGENNIHGNDNKNNGSNLHNQGQHKESTDMSNNMSDEQLTSLLEQLRKVS